MSDAVDQLDINRLGPWLEQAIPNFRRLRQAEKFAGGQSNPTFKLVADSGQYVLRRKPPGLLLASAHQVDREYRVIKALQDTEVPVPRALALCEDDSVIGSMFYVMSFEAGRIFWDPVLPQLQREERRAIYDDMNRVLAALHNVDLDAVGLADFGRPGNYFARQISRWSKQYQASETGTIPEMDRLIEWLPANVPADDDQTTLIHGDYRLDNIMFHATEPRAIAVLDWELSTTGHPIADLAYQCMQWRLGSVGTGVLRGLGDEDRPALGIPSEEEYVASYCRRRGLDAVPHWRFYVAFSFFRLAAILQGVYKRGLDGNASNAAATAMGEAVRPLAQEALRELGL